MAARSRIFGAVAALVLLCPTLWSLDLKQGRMKLTLFEGLGRFSMAYLIDVKGGAYKALLSDKDPRTSFVSLAIGNKVYRLGESSEFRGSVERTDGGARFVWTSPMLRVTEDFSFVSSAGSPLADGVRIDLVLKNVSQQSLTVGVRYLFDTSLGEPSYVHFRTDKIPEISRELTLAKDDRALSWISPLVGDPEQFGLMCMLSGEGISVPDRVVFANWKRLSDASWGYETSGTRNFNLLPYSVNDSAVSHYFDPRPLDQGAEWRVVTVMGRSAPEGFSILPASARGARDLSAALKQALDASKNIPDKELAARADLNAINTLLESIDAKLASGQPVTDDELALMTQALTELKRRIASYQKN